MQINDRMRDFAARYAAAWCSRNPASVAAFHAMDGSLSINGGPAARGRAAIEAEARAFMNAFPDMRVSFDRLVESGNLMQFHWTLTGTYTGPGGTGKRVRISGFEEWRISGDGLIAESQGHFDADDYKRQLEHGAD
jgi:predicted ester cyclase